MKSTFTTILPCASIAAMLLAGSAIAQTTTAEAPARSEETLEEVVVTGTLIRGVAAGGSQTIGVNEEEIAAVGAANTSQLLVSIPQVGGFLTVPAIVGRNSTRLTVNRPTLRNLGGANAATASTLVLLDGHRMVGMGIRNNSPDVDAIAPGAIERVEIVTDGGSSTYGADAVGGVINFITRKNFDGLQINGRYGVADDYDTFDADLTVGKTWSWGSVYVSYNYAEHDWLYGRDRDYVQKRDWVNNVPQDTQCDPGNVSVGGLYALPVPTPATGLTAGLGNRCDNGEGATIFPKEERHSVYAGFTVDNGGPVTFAVKGFYMDRLNTSDTGEQGTSVTLNPLTALGAPNPFYRPINNPPTPNPAETVLFSLTPVVGPHNIKDTTLDAWQVTPSMSADLGSNWQLNALVTYGEGNSEFAGALINPSTLPLGAAFGTFDPFDLTSPASVARIRTATDYIEYGRAKNELLDARVVVDGALFALPGGDVRVALGGEYMEEKFSAAIASVPSAQIPSIPVNKASRDITSLFGEINVPIIGEGNRGAIYALSLTASARYDDYSDFGDTTNPKFGIDFAPLEWLKLRANWGESFQAPGLVDSPSIQPPTLVNVGQVLYPSPFPGAPVTPGQTQVFLSGILPDLKPQTAETWSFGFDLTPPILEGLSVGATYYNVKFKDQIGIVPIFIPTTFYSQFQDTYTLYTVGIPAMTAAAAALAAQAVNPATLLAVPVANLYLIADTRVRNLARVETDGIDFYLRYRHETGFGAVFVNGAGNYILHLKNQSNPNAPLTDVTRNSSRLNTSLTLGAEISKLTAQATWARSSSFAVTPSAANLQQSDVDSYSVVNMYFNYKVEGESFLFRDLSFSLNIDNVLDEDPPLYRGSIGVADGYSNGFTLGRLFKAGFSKKF